MKITELVVSLVLAAGAAGVMGSTLDVPALAARTAAVSGPASCRAVAAAVVAHTAEHDVPPARLGDLAPYLDGDVTGYRLVAGRVVGPGCPAD